MTCDIWDCIVQRVIGRLYDDHMSPRQPGQTPGCATSNHSHKRGAVMKKVVIGGIVLVLVT